MQKLALEQTASLYLLQNSKTNQLHASVANSVLQKKNV